MAKIFFRFVGALGARKLSFLFGARPEPCAGVVGEPNPLAGKKVLQ
jgi:hypothetical protein